MAIEIERKFYVEKLPDQLLEGYAAIEIRQGYLAIHEDFTEVRIRSMNNTYWQTVKTAGSQLSRTEIEFPLKKELFDELWPLTKGRNLSKTRYNIPYHKFLVDLDVYQESLQGIIVAEVEFTSEEEAKAFTPPDWFSREITGVKAFKNFILATRGKPLQIE